MEVLIIGAGSTGLLLAQGLKKAGISFKIFDRETPDIHQNRGREWGMSLHWGTESIGTVLPQELQTRIKEAATDPFWEPPEDGGLTLPQYAGHSGELLNVVPMSKDALRVNRRKLRKLFSEGIEIKYGKRLQSIAQLDAGVTAVFEDGSQATGSILIGCDGSSSKVRELLLGPERSRKQSTGVRMMNFTTKFDPETSRMIRAKHSIYFISYHANGYMFLISIQDVLDPEDPRTWTFQLLFSWMGSPAPEDLETQDQRTAFLRSIASEYSEPWHTVLKDIPSDAKFTIDDGVYWEPFDWSAEPLASHVTLAGDAAHPMPPSRGQGLNNALEDAALLTNLLAKANERFATEAGAAAAAAAALREYEQEMIPRATKEIGISRTAAASAHNNFERIMNSPQIKFGHAKVADVK